jgi:hypothetical protein
MTTRQFRRRLAIANTLEGAALLLFLASLAALAHYLVHDPTAGPPLIPGRWVSAGVALAGTVGAAGAIVRDSAWLPRG